MNRYLPLLRCSFTGALATSVHYLKAQVAATLAALLLTFQLNKTWSFT